VPQSVRDRTFAEMEKKIYETARTVQDRIPGKLIDPFEMAEVSILVSQAYYTIGNVKTEVPPSMP